MGWQEILVAVITGGIFTTVIDWMRTRKKTASETTRIDVETKLASLNVIIERLDEEVKRVLEDRERLKEEFVEDRRRVNEELEAERERSRKQRLRILELEEEIDGIRQAARDTQQRCDELGMRLKSFTTPHEDL